MFAVPGSVLCPVRALKHMFDTIPGRDTSPLFAVSAGKAMSYEWFQKRLKQVIKQLGFRPEAFSSHSMRRGGMEWAYMVCQKISLRFMEIGRRRHTGDISSTH